MGKSVWTSRMEGCIGAPADPTFTQPKANSDPYLPLFGAHHPSEMALVSPTLKFPSGASPTQDNAQKTISKVRRRRARPATTLEPHRRVDRNP